MPVPQLRGTVPELHSATQRLSSACDICTITITMKFCKGATANNWAENISPRNSSRTYTLRDYPGSHGTRYQITTTVVLDEPLIDSGLTALEYMGTLQRVIKWIALIFPLISTTRARENSHLVIIHLLTRRVAGFV